MTRRGLALFALLSVLCGLPYLLIKIAVGEVSVPFLVFARAATGAQVASRWLKDIPASALTAACLFGAALACAGAATLSWPEAMPSQAVVWSIVGLGVLCTALAFTCFFMLAREVGPERAAVITYAAPAVTVMASILILSEPLDARIGAAFALILCGSFLATARDRPVAAPAAAT